MAGTGCGIQLCISSQSLALAAHKVEAWARIVGQWQGQAST